MDRGLRAGDVVVMRPAAEILATLDGNGCLEGLPFMPEMLAYVGRRLTVAGRAEKICDTVGPGGTSRRMRGVVYLEELRCDGSRHDGCEQECRLYWKEAWLRRASAQGLVPVAPDREEIRRAEAALAPTTRRDGGLYCCQATEAFRASEPLESWQPGQYVREIACGNVGWGPYLRVMARVLAAHARRLAGRVLRFVGLRRSAPPAAPPMVGRHERTEPLNLQPGELVEIKPREEILKTLDASWKTRGLAFSAPEMLPLAGRRFRVRRRLAKFINERTGAMVRLKTDCLVLEGCACTGELSPGRWFCGRKIFPWWREAWLRRVGPPSQG